MHKEIKEQSFSGQVGYGTMLNTPKNRTAMQEQPAQQYYANAGAEVPEWFGNLEVSMSALEASVGSLIARLEAVSHDSSKYAKTDGGSKNAPEIALVPMASELRNKVYRIQALTESINTTTHNLEI